MIFKNYEKKFQNISELTCMRSSERRCNYHLFEYFWKMSISICIKIMKNFHQWNSKIYIILAYEPSWKVAEMLQKESAIFFEILPKGFQLFLDP